MGVDEIKKLLKTEALVIGADEALKALRNNELTKIFLASNTPAALVQDVEHYAAISKTEVEKLEVQNDDLGVICKKPFSIGCIGMRKVAEAKKKF